MPIYEHLCPSCGPFERFASMDEGGDRSPCPACGKPAERCFSFGGSSSLGRSSVGSASIERAHSGEPRVQQRGGERAGRGHVYPHGPAHGGRPWQVGH